MTHNETPSSAISRDRPADLVRLMRIYQWPKNAFVLVGIMFGHYWMDPTMLTAALSLAFAFCLVSSAVYVINDIVDVEDDRLHPRKQFRPIPSGSVRIRTAWIFAAVLASTSLALAAAIAPMAAGLIASYFLMNLAYSYRLKQVVILDVFIIALGFMIRILVGTLALGIPPSKWLLFCGLMLTLFLGFTKRRAELQASKSTSRRVLESYTPALLDNIISINVACVLTSYSLYTMAPETLRIHQTNDLIATVPIIAYALFRYLYVLYKLEGGQDPSRELFKDKHIVGSGVLWILVTFALIIRGG